MKKLIFAMFLPVLFFSAFADEASSPSPTTVGCANDLLPRLHVDAELPVREQIGKIREFLNLRVLGQKGYIDSLLISLLTGGHIVVTGQPGTAKTEAAKLLASAISGKTGRQQFDQWTTRDDLIGTFKWDNKQGKEVFKPGPVYSTVFLGDELNRGSTASVDALITCMAEQSILVDGRAEPLPEIFLVIGTKNPDSDSGTNEISHAMMDRFLFSLNIGLTGEAEEEMAIARLMIQKRLEAGVDPIARAMSQSFVVQARKEVWQNAFSLPPEVNEEILRIVLETRKYGKIEWGTSPRGTEGLMLAVAGLAWIEGREPTVEDVKSLAPSVLGHRLKLNDEAAIERVSPESIIEKIVGQ